MSETKPTAVTGSLDEIEWTAMTGSLTLKTVKPIIIVTTTTASSIIPTVIHVAFVGLHLDGDGFTNFDFAEVVVISSIVERRGFPCFDVLIPSVTDTEKSEAKGSSRSCREVMKT